MIGQTTLERLFYAVSEGYRAAEACFGLFWAALCNDGMQRFMQQSTVVSRCISYGTSARCVALLAVSNRPISADVAHSMVSCMLGISVKTASK